MHILFQSIFALLLYSIFANSQLINGQFFTNGLAISNAPAPNGQHTVGGNMPISVDVSGNGRLAQTASIPGSTLPTAFISLNIYLVSSQTNVNITVSEGPQFLAGEQGSTVKHLDWRIPDCVPAGEYNFTYYEMSRINQVNYFAITPIPLSILRPSGNSGAASETCNGSTAPQSQPQVFSPISSNPFLNPTLALTTNPTVTPGAIQAEATAVPDLRFMTSAVRMDDNDNEGVVTMLQPSYPINGATVVVMELPRESESNTEDARILVPVNGAIGHKIGVVGWIGQVGLVIALVSGVFGFIIPN